MSKACSRLRGSHCEADVAAPAPHMVGDKASEDEESLALGSTPGAASVCSPSPLLADGESDSSGGDLLARDEPVQWQPGRSASEAIGRNAPLGSQGQVLLANTVVALRGLPGALCKRLLAAVRPGRPRDGVVYSVAASLLGLSASAVRRLFKAIEANGWVPVQPKEKFGRSARSALELDVAEACPPTSEACPPSGAEVDAEVNLIRIALGNAVEGRSFQEFERDVLRYRAAGAQVGGLSCRNLAGSRVLGFWAPSCVVAIWSGSMCCGAF